MTIYVDDMQRRARVGRITAVWSHLVSDLPGEEGTAELVAFAKRIGLNPAWIQSRGKPTEHFDVTEAKRQAALRAGALPVKYGAEGAAITLSKRRAAHPDD